MSEESERPDPLVGQTVAGRYKVQKKLGEGGMGAVYLAEHELIEKKVALKVLHPEYSAKGDIVQRFQQEAISASRIKHPNVLEIFDFGQLDSGSHFLAMEFLEGHDLAEDLLDGRTVDPSRGIHIALQICRALAAAHARGVVHRDMKPENVFLLRTPDGEEIVKIVDFGIAQLREAEDNETQAKSQQKKRKLTKTGMIFGTPEYMSPEQAAGKRADLRVDIYATGIILYEMFTGAVPFTGETFMAVLAAHLNDTPPPLTQVAPNIAISAELQGVIMRALAKKPEERFQSMAELAQALLSTPEGMGTGPQTHMPMPDARPSNVPGAPGASGPYTQQGGPATAAQFSQNPQLAGGTAAQFGGGAAPPPTQPGSATAAHGSGPVNQHTAVSPGGSQTVGGGSMDPAEADRVSRAHTHLDAATSHPPAPPAKSSKLGLLVAAVLVAGVVVAGGVFAMVRASASDGDPGPAADATESAEPEAPASASAAPAAVASSAAPSEPDPKKKKVTLKVVTDPEGATVHKDGFQVCSKAPCEVFAAPDETLELTAQKGAAKGAVKVLAQKDQTITIKLKAPVRRPTPTPGPGPKKMCEVEVDGLKILRPCK